MTRAQPALVAILVLVAVSCGGDKDGGASDAIAETIGDSSSDGIDPGDTGVVPDGLGDAPRVDALETSDDSEDTTAADTTAADTAPNDTAPNDTFEPDPEEVSRATFDALTASVAAPYAPPSRPEATLGTLALGLHPHVVPIVTAPQGVLVATSALGAGRVVAFSGQDFLSSSDRSTLLGHAGTARLLANAARWARGDRAGRILVDNEAVRATLDALGIADVDVVASDGDLRRWSEDLSAYAVVAVQINEWGTARVTPDHIPHLRDFVSAGGGLLVAGSALHWSWWLGAIGAFPGDTLLDGAGIAWNADDHPDLSGAIASFDPFARPLALWNAWVDGQPIADSGYVTLPSLFPAALDLGLDVDGALLRLVAETPALPSSAALPEARLAAGIVRTMPPHRWPGLHPWAATFPGLVPADAPRVTELVTVDRRWVGPVPLGLYAPPGEVVVVRLPSDIAGLTVRVGELHDELADIADITTWERAPLTYRTFAASGELTVGSPLGGTLYLHLPEDGVMSGTFEVEVSGAVLQPYYVAGQTSPEAWSAARTRPAPQAVLELPGKVRLSVRSSALQVGDDPAAIMSYWGGFYDSHFALSQEPSPRRLASHMLFDPQVGWGYANATRDRINHPRLAEEWALRRDLANEDIWLFGHELGHQFQTEDWGGGDITEVAVNLFTMYTLNGYRNGGGDRETRGFKDNQIDHAALSSLRWPSADLFEKLEMYRQLVFEFGWSTFQAVFASYYDPASDRAVDGSYMDGFAIRFSRVTGRDLVGFFDHWRYPLSDAARARISELALDPWLPPGW